MNLEVEVNAASCESAQTVSTASEQDIKMNGEAVELKKDQPNHHHQSADSEPVKTDHKFEHEPPPASSSADTLKTSEQNSQLPTYYEVNRTTLR